VIPRWSLRSARPDDAPFIAEMLYEAAFWRSDGPRPAPADALASPHVARYVEGWGRPGDTGLIAVEDGGRPIGAAWYRVFSDDRPGYGFVDASVPEMSIAVVRERRGRGVGAALLDALLARARAEGHPGLSLSVEADNPAVALYERRGFVKVSTAGGPWTMSVDLG
jgi:GNAT superfamily N-acetyltransferase